MHAPTDLDRGVRNNTVETIDGCLMWTGNHRNGVPLFWGHSIRRLLWEREHGELPTSLLVVSAIKGVHCDCMCVRHLATETRSQVSLRADRRPEALNYMRRLQARMRNASCKLNFEKARAIRADPRPERIAAPDYGVSPSMIVKVRRNLAWKEHFAGRSVFEQAWRTNGTHTTESDAALQADGARQGQPRQRTDGQRVRGRLQAGPCLRGSGVGGDAGA